VQGTRVATGLAAIFGVTALLFAVFGVVFNLVFFAVTVVFGAVAYFMWDHGSGRFARRLYRNVERSAAVDGGRGRRSGGGDRGGFGAGPREEWQGPREEQRERARRRARQQADGGQRRQRRRRRPPNADDGPTVAEAYDRLGLDPSADEGAVREAYRSKVKEVHPDASDGDEEAFKEITAAYERLTD
jgi:curved DNA-binding protein CbpA